MDYTLTDLLLTIVLLVLVFGVFLLWRTQTRRTGKTLDTPTGTAYLVDAAGNATKEELACTPWDKFISWHRRHGVAWYAFFCLLIFIFGPFLTEWLQFTLTDTPPIVPGQADPDGAQVFAARHAEGWKSLGAITSIIFGAIGFFAVGILLVWRAMHYIFPELPAWSKKHYSDKFRESTDTKWQIDTINRVTVCMWLFFAACLLAASLSQ